MNTVPYREALVSWLLRERLGQADQNDLIWMPRLVVPEVPPTVQIGGSARVYPAGPRVVGGPVIANAPSARLHVYAAPTSG